MRTQRKRKKYSISLHKIILWINMGKTLYIIAGCNGAGKTTASLTMLPEIWKCREFVNADEIAKGLSPYNPESVAIEAGRLMLKRIDFLLQGNESFSIETTLSTRSYSKTIERAHANGFKVQLLFFWLPNSTMAIERVKQRVIEGGHNIPKDVIIRRYQAGIENFFKIYSDIVDSWLLVENYSVPRIIIAKGGKDGDLDIIDDKLYKTIKDYVRQ